MSGYRQPGIIRAIAVLAGFILFTGTNAAWAEIRTVTYHVSSATDDGYAWSPTEQDISSGDLIIGDDRTYTSPYYMSAMRFSNVSIPRSAAIVEAHLKIRSLSEGIRGQVYGVIQAEATDDSQDFAARHISDANKTAAAEDWDHKLAWDKNTWQISPDISPIVQEVVDRPGWNPGQALALFYSTRSDSGKSRMFGSFEADPTFAALLETTCQLYVISGRVTTPDGNGVDGVAVSPGGGVANTITDSNGYYELVVPPGWSGTVMPSKADWLFDPRQRSYADVAENQLNQDFGGRLHPYGGGSGTTQEPFLISDANHMQAIGTYPQDWDANFLLTADINMGNYTGSQYNIIGYWIDSYNHKAFTGVFDGNGHQIQNFTYQATNERNVGVFGFAGGGSQIKNLTLINVDIDVEGSDGDHVSPLVGYLQGGLIIGCVVDQGRVSGWEYVGGLVGSNEGTIENCSASVRVDGRRCVGGLVGYQSRYHGGVYTGVIKNCIASGTVTGSSEVGGLLGYGLLGGSVVESCATGNVGGGSQIAGLIGHAASTGAIEDCHATGRVSGSENIGGLVGKLDGTTVNRCFATGDVVASSWPNGGLVGVNIGAIRHSYATGDVVGTRMVGGISGQNGGIDPYPDWPSIADCYATGSVSGTEWCGGIVGYQFEATVARCYSIGTVSADIAPGGLVGKNLWATILDSFWDSHTSGLSNMCGERYGGTGCNNDYGKTTGEMQTKSTFTGAGWDFVNIWDICEGTNYPRLVWQIPAADFLCPDGVNFIDYACFTDVWNTSDPNADLDLSGLVDPNDLKIFCDHWLDATSY